MTRYTCAALKIQCSERRHLFHARFRALRRQRGAERGRRGSRFEIDREEERIHSGASLSVLPFPDVVIFHRSIVTCLIIVAVASTRAVRQRERESWNSIEHSSERVCRWIAGLCRRFILAADISIRRYGRRRRRQNWRLRAKVNTLFLHLLLSFPFHQLFRPERN